MKRFLRIVFILPLFLLMAQAVQSQTPHKFTYQAVVRNDLNQLVRNRMVGVKLSIHKDNETGLLMYEETHLTPTNDNGLFTVAIGEGSDQSGSLTSIEWGNGVYYLVTDLDPNGGTNYTLTSSQQLLSVPYALHCDEFQDLLDVVQNSNRANMRQLKDVEDPTEPQDAVTKIYLDSVINSVYEIMSTERRDTAAVACASFTWRGNTYTSTGVYFYRMTGAGCDGSCDSVVTLRLTINAGTFHAITDTLCSGTYTWNTQKGSHGNGSTYSTTGTYISSYADSYGCPSADTLHLSVGTTTYGTETVDRCENYTWWGTSYTSSTTTPTHTYERANRAGCDSVVTLHLTIRYNTTGIDYQTACDNYVWPVNNSPYIASTTEPYPSQTLTGQASNGCDSTVSLHLTINHNEGSIENHSFCEGSGYEWHGTTYTQATTETIQETDANGCVGNIVLNLMMIPRPQVSIADVLSSNGTTICEGDNTTLTASLAYNSGTITYAWSPATGLSASTGSSVIATPTADVTYTVTATASAEGCADVTDSRSITLTVTPAPTVTLAAIADQTVCDGGSATFVASATASAGTPTYTWSNGATGNSITVSQVGSYTATATATANGCTGTDSKTATLSIETPTLTLGNILANGSATTTTSVNADAALTLAANVTSSTGTLSYAWSTTAYGNTDAGTSASISPSTATAGTTTYYLRVTTTTANGCTKTEDKSISVTVTACSLNPTLSFTSSSYSGGTNANIPVQVSVGTLDGGSNGGYTWDIVSSTAPGAVLNNGSYSYQKNVYATGAGTVTVRCTMHVTKGSCEKDVSATATVTITACSVTINSLSFDRPSGAYAYSKYPVQLNATYSVTPASATLSWNWERYSTSTYSLVSSTNYFIGNTKSNQNAYILPTSSGSLYYGVTLTATYGGCSVSKTYNGSVSTTTGWENSTSRTVTVTKSGSNKISISGTAGNKSHYMCASVVPQNNTTCVGTGTSSSSNSTYLKSSGTTSTAKTITYTFPSTPPSGTSVVVYTWFASSSGCTASSSSYAQGSIKTTTLTF